MNSTLGSVVPLAMFFPNIVDKLIRDKLGVTCDPSAEKGLGTEERGGWPIFLFASHLKVETDTFNFCCVLLAVTCFY